MKLLTKKALKSYLKKAACAFAVAGTILFSSPAQAEIAEGNVLTSEMIHALQDQFPHDVNLGVQDGHTFVLLKNSVRVHELLSNGYSDGVEVLCSVAEFADDMSKPLTITSYSYTYGWCTVCPFLSKDGIPLYGRKFNTSYLSDHPAEKALADTLLAIAVQAGRMIPYQREVPKAVPVISSPVLFDNLNDYINRFNSDVSKLDPCFKIVDSDISGDGSVVLKHANGTPSFAKLDSSGRVIRVFFWISDVHGKNLKNDFADQLVKVTAALSILGYGRDDLANMLTLIYKDKKSFRSPRDNNLFLCVAPTYKMVGNCESFFVDVWMSK